MFSGEGAALNKPCQVPGILQAMLKVAQGYWRNKASHVGQIYHDLEHPDTTLLSRDAVQDPYKVQIYPGTMS